MSSDRRSEGSDGELIDPEASETGKPASISPDALVDDPEDDEATLLARIPDELLADSGQGYEEAKGGLRQLFSRGAGEPPKAPPPSARQAAPSSKESDALLDMLLDDAREDKKRAAPPPPPPRAARAIPPPPPRKAPPPPPPTPTPASVRAHDRIPPSRNELPTIDAEVDARALFEEADEAPRELPPAVELGSELEDESELVPEPVEQPSRLALPSKRPPAAAFESEEDASSLLLRSQQHAAWLARAEWLRAEASALEEKEARGRALLTVAELYAMCGEETQARAVAQEARELAPNLALAHRLVRGLLAREGDWAGVLEIVDAEARASSSPAARYHDVLLGAEISRLCLRDEEGVKKRIDQAARLVPSDPRAHVQRFCELLAMSDEDAAAAIPKLRIPDTDELGPLVDAVAQVAAHRDLPLRGQRSIGSVYEALLKIRASISAGDHKAVVEGLEGLLRSASLAGGAGWLAASVAAAHKETRGRAIEALRGVLEGSHEALARRAMAARAIELGDSAAARAATEATDSDAFTAADRTVLTALSGGARADIEPWLDDLLGESDLSPLPAAASAALQADTPKRAVYTIGGAEGRAAAMLGRTMAATTEDALRSAVIGYADSHPESHLSRALSLELDLEEGAGDKVAQAVAALREDAEAERSLAAAIIAEAAGDVERAKEEFEKVRAADPTSEMAARAAATYSGGEAAAILAEHARALEGGTRAAMLLTEAAVLYAMRGEDAESEALLRRAIESDASLPFAHYLGERGARAQGERGAVIDWIRSRREIAEDTREKAYELVREAMRIAGSDAAAAASLLEQALGARPGDMGLRYLFERLSPEPPPDRAAFRLERAAETTGPEAARLALEAALELEQSGDLGAAAAAARQAIVSGETFLAPLIAYRAALAGQGTGDLIDALLPRARETDDPIERLEIYERLAELDERGRGDATSGLLWRRTIIEETPAHLPTLRRIATTLISAGRDADLEPIALEIARTLQGPEAIAHAMLSARLRHAAASWDETREPVEIAYRNEPRGVWTLRQMAAHARAQNQLALAVETDRQLLERTDRPSETATISLRAAQGALKAGMVEDALSLLGQAIDIVPGHLVVHLECAAALEQTENFAGAAASLEAAANASVTPQERASNLYRAAILWQDKVGDTARARIALENVAALDPSYGDVFQRLQAIYVAEGARAELAELLKRRLDAVTDPAERVEMEVLRGRALADVGDSAAAKQALAAALEANPDHAEALSAFGDVSVAEGDWAGAEQAFIRLARLVTEPERQVAIYYRLGELYDQYIPNPERAELAYEEILKRAPNDLVARERLVALFLRIGDSARAIEQQTQLINSAEAPTDKCHRTTQLADIYEQSGDTKKAETTLLQARKTWPKDEVALGALARFYARTGQTQAATVLLDRAVADARRALGTGRFEPYLFSTVATVAELRGRPDAARAAKAAVAALEGAPAELDSAGNTAGSAELDDMIAPDLVTPAFRELLKKTGQALDAGVPFDLNAVRAVPLPGEHAELGFLINTLASTYGLSGVQVYISGALGTLGPTVVPVSSNPPTLLIGEALLASPREDVRAFLIHRALKVLQTNAAAFSRTAPIDLWPLLAAYLKSFSPSWSPQGIDAAKLRDFHGRISQALPGGPSPQLGLLASEVIGSIGNRASTLNTVINGWGNRAALLAVGDLNVALTGIAWAAGHTNAPPAGGKERMTWIGRNAEARDLVVFSVSDGFSDARAHLGLTIG